MSDFNVGDHFWYANKNTKIVEECIVKFVSYGGAKVLHARKILSGEQFVVFANSGCYKTFAEAYDNLRK